MLADMNWVCHELCLVVSETTHNNSPTIGPQMTRTALILVAAGKGTRAKTTIPKQYERIGDKTLLSHTLSNLRIAHDFTEIRVVVSTDDIWIDTELEIGWRYR